MGLAYNSETAVLRNDKIYKDMLETSEQYTKGLTANETQKITNAFNFSSGALPATYTTTQDIILTCVSLSCNTPVGGLVSCNALIDTATIATLSAAGGHANKVIPLPNWQIPAGTLLSITIGGGGNAAGEFIGYLVDF